MKKGQEEGGRCGGMDKRREEEGRGGGREREAMCFATHKMAPISTDQLNRIDTIYLNEATLPELNFLLFQL